MMEEIKAVVNLAARLIGAATASITIGFASLSSPLTLPSFAQGSTSSAPTSSTVVPVSLQEAGPSRQLAKKCSPRVSVTSQPRPLPGQKHRSSRNIDLNAIKVGQVFRVSVPTGISFDIKRDIRLATDPTLVKGMRAGLYRRVSSYPLKPVYTANPRGAKTPFTAIFCGL